MVILTISHELMKFKSFEWLNCVLTYVTSYTQISMKNMLIVAYM